MASPYPRGRNDFKIAILCALPLEAEMVHTAFDVDWADHGGRYGRAPRDENSYTTGVIGDHNVVLVHMPGMGTTTAAAVARDLQSSFRNIEIVFVVGVCGIVPIHPETKEQIILGDCVISTAVQQYDFGRHYPGAFIQKLGTKDSLGRPRPAIRSLLAKLTTSGNHSRLTERLRFHLCKLQDKKKGLVYPGIEKDKLFESTYIHQHHEEGHRCEMCLERVNVCKQDCDSLGCSDSHLVNRILSSREDESQSKVLALCPRIHFDPYGSANTVMKSGMERDSLATRLGIVAFDMEGAGFWEHFPTLIVKAGCDYADSHKNKEWQRYASASAAAALKAILEQWEMSQELSTDDNMDIDIDSPWSQHDHRFQPNIPVPTQRVGMPWLAPHLRYKAFPRNLHNYTAPSSFSAHAEYVSIPPLPLSGFHESEPYNDESVALFPFDQSTFAMKEMKREASALYSWNLYEILGAPPYEDPLERHASAKLDDTCDWIFRNATYQDWSLKTIDITTKFLWLYGLPGTGKTITCATVIKQLQKTSPLVLHYFSSAHNRSDATLDAIIRHWLSEIARHQNGFFLAIKALQHVYRGGFLSVSGVWMVFEYIVPHLKGCIFVLDGFDEFAIPSRTEFLIKLKQYIKGTSAKVLIVSRDELDIRSELASNSAITLELSFASYQIVREDTRTDIELVSSKIVQNKLPGQDGLLLNKLASSLVERCDGMFLWVELAAKQLNNGESAASLGRIVNRAPAGLDDLYKRKWQDVLQEPEAEGRLRALRILAWCAYALSPLTVSQLSEAIIIRPDDTARDFDEDELIRPISNDFIKYCIIRLCGPFLEIRSATINEPLADRTVHLVHASAKEFLFSVLPHSLPSNGSKETQSLQSAPHLFLAKACLRYLCYKNIDGTTMVCDTPKWTLHQYANDNWNKHQELSHINDQEYYDLVTKFLNVDNPNFTAWSATFGRSSKRITRSPEFIFQLGSPLYCAALLGMVPVLEKILKHDIEQLNHISGYYGTALQAASARGNNAVFNLLLKWNANVDVEAGLYGTALIAAARNNHPRMVKELLIRGANADMKSFYGNTAACVAAEVGALEILKLLFTSSADINITGYYGWTPLNAASANGHLETVQFLINNSNASVDIASSNGCTPLMSASANGHLETVQFLMNNSNADINISDNDRWTPLKTASFNGYLEVVRLLINGNADINIASNYGWTPLMSASSKGHLEVVRLLINNDADVNMTNNDGCTPLMFASHDGYLEVARLLINGNANINITSNYGWTALMFTSFKGHLEVVRLLISSNADINIVNDKGETSLHIASRYGCLETVQLLINCKADINMANNEGDTPLFIASQRGHLKVVRLLLDQYGANINIATNYGLTPLYIASFNGHLDVVRLLVDEYGADINLTDDNGWTPLRIALYKGHLEVIQLFLREGPSPAMSTFTEDNLFFIAVRKGHLDVIKVLVNKLTEGRLPDRSTRQVIDEELQLLVDSHGRTISHYAALSGSVEILSYFLNGKSVHANEDKFGRNMFDYASMSGSLEMIEKVLELYQHNNLNTKSSSQWSPLHWACRNGSHSILELLIKSHVQSWEVDTNLPAVSWLPLDIAVYWKNTNIVSKDGRILENQSWVSTMSPEKRTSYATSAPMDIFRSNSLGPFEKAFNGYCDGCYSDIIGHRFHCKTCLDFDYCFLCKHGSELAHPGHLWDCIEPLVND